MTSSHLIAQLKLLLPETAWPWVFPALRQDSTIWEMLSGEFGIFILDRRSTQIREYSPASLALLALGYTNGMDGEDAEILPASLAEEPPPFADTSLARAGRLALELHSRRPQVGSWRGLSPDLAAASPTTLACLFGLLPDGIEMLRVVAMNGARGSAPAPGMRLALHALLSNPLPPEAQRENLAALAGVLPAAQQADFLQQVYALRPDLRSATRPKTWIASPASSILPRCTGWQSSLNRPSTCWITPSLPRSGCKRTCRL
jgi:hypothetical protein